MKWSVDKLLITVVLPGLAGCGGSQSVLAPAGKDAEILSDLFWVLLIGAVVLWLMVNGLFFYVTRIAPRRLSRTWAEVLVIGGGIVFPTVILASLLWYSLSIMPDQRAPGTADISIRVTGEQWWWRVEYKLPDTDTYIQSANEIRLPVGLRTEIKLQADKVIHSFWVPSLAGKVDMIPGRSTRIALEPQRTGVYRGQCAEFCGTSHAFMALYAVVMPQQEFRAWIEKQSQNAAEPSGATSRRGLQVFMSEGCGACHTIRGTQAAGPVGPDLTHMGSRVSLAAATLEPDVESLTKWLRHPAAIKPRAAMPAYHYLSDQQLASLSAYLLELR